MAEVNPDTVCSVTLSAYRPPPAQAQAHPAQAQAHAHTQWPPPPPPLKLPFEVLVATFGAGLVTEVIREVNSFILPTTFEENVCTPLVIDFVKSAPPTRGATPPPSEAGASVGDAAALPKVGS